MMKTIVALDPGGTTGWATAEMELLPGIEERGGVYAGPEKIKWNRGQLVDKGHHRELYNLLGFFHTAEYAIVSESFEYRNNSRAGLVLDSLEYIGVTKLFGQERDVPVHMQTASMGKGFVKDEHIKKMDLWFSAHKDRHAMDATRHLLYYMIHSDKVCKDSGVTNWILRKGWK